MKQTHTWIITVAILLGSAAQSFCQTQTSKEFTKAKAKILSHVKQRIDETLYFEVSKEELSALGDSGEILSSQIFQLINTWGEIAQEKDSIENDLHKIWSDMPFDKDGPIAIIWDTIAQKDSALATIYSTLLATRKEFANLLWLKLFKFPEEMKTFRMTLSPTTDIAEKEPVMNSYLDFIFTFDAYCGERLHPSDGPRGITVRGDPEKVVLVF